MRKTYDVVALISALLCGTRIAVANFCRASQLAGDQDRGSHGSGRSRCCRPGPFPKSSVAHPMKGVS